MATLNGDESQSRNSFHVGHDGMRAPTVGILTHTAIADDPRVRRQVEAFVGAGWNVHAFGASGSRSGMPPGQIHEVQLPTANRTFAARAKRLAALSQLKVAPQSYQSVFWRLPENYDLIRQVARRYDTDLWIANDWPMLPIVTDVARARSRPFIYDTHEFAFDEFPDNWRWRTFVRPLVRRIEAEGIAKAGHVTCVSDGIAARLQDVHRLLERPSVIRNLPAFQDPPFRAAEGNLRVLYHGIVTPQRGLEETIRSVALWRPEFELVIRGPSAPLYARHLKALAEECGVADRVTFAPPVPFTQLVERAAEQDIGFFVLPANSAQNRYVLPNKLFEYIMAGLAVCVSDVPEMASIVHRFGCGALVEGLEPQDIANAVNRLERVQINHFKERSIAARPELCWEKEKTKLLAIAERMVRSSGNGASSRRT